MRKRHDDDSRQSVKRASIVVRRGSFRRRVGASGPLPINPVFALVVAVTAATAVSLVLVWPSERMVGASMLDLSPELCRSTPSNQAQFSPTCGGGGPTPVTYTYEGSPSEAITVNGQALSNGESITLDESVKVPASFLPDYNAYPGWASTGGGSFACTTCSSTTFDPGSGGYIYLISNFGSGNWGGYELVGNPGPGRIKDAVGTIEIPPASTFSGPCSSSEVSFWVGLGGFGAENIGTWPFWQAGVIANCQGGTVLFYEGGTSQSNFQTAIELTTEGVPPAAGETLTIYLSFTSAGGHVCFNLPTWSGCYTDSVLIGVTSANTAEWVTEAPTLGNGNEATLPDFGLTTFHYLVPTPAAGTLMQTSLLTCFNGASCETPGQSFTPSAFITGDFNSGFTTSYSGVT